MSTFLCKTQKENCESSHKRTIETPFQPHQRRDITSSPQSFCQCHQSQAISQCQRLQLHTYPTAPQKHSCYNPTIIQVNVNAVVPHSKPPLLPQRSQILLMQMIILHHEQHIRHRKQRQCHKQVNPMPSHKRKPTSRLKNRTKEDEPN